MAHLQWRIFGMSDRLQGTTREMGGRVQQTLGDMAGDAKTQAAGLYNQAAGQAQEQVAKLSDVIKDQPITSALVAIGVGYLLGRLTG
jgi:uncharacterized protein YjbJ (UPF0337 family)